MTPAAFRVFALVVPAVVVALDQLSKWGATRAFGQPMDVCAAQPGISLRMDVTPVVDLMLKCNTGVSFGMLGGDNDLKRWGLTALALAVCALLVWTLRTTNDRVSAWGLALIIGGAVGNAIDRALYGAVTDFIDATDLVPVFTYIFNVADSAISVGVVLMIWGAFREARAAKAAGPT